MRSGAGIHVKYVPGTFVPLANKTNDYMIDRAAQKQGVHYSGVAGIGMQDASLQESMGPIQDRSRENLCPTDLGIVRTRRLLLKAAEDNRLGRALPGLAPAEQHVRSCSIVLPRDKHFKEHARHGLFAPLDTEPTTV
jgi:phthalate 4,5-dioxygenase